MKLKQTKTVSKQFRNNRETVCFRENKTLRPQTVSFQLNFRPSDRSHEISRLLLPRSCRALLCGAGGRSLSRSFGEVDSGYIILWLRLSPPKTCRHVTSGPFCSGRQNVTRHRVTATEAPAECKRLPPPSGAGTNLKVGGAGGTRPVQSAGISLFCPSTFWLYKYN